MITTLRMELPPQALSEAPTVAEMATVIVQHQAVQADEYTVRRLLAEPDALLYEPVRVADVRLAVKIAVTKKNGQMRGREGIRPELACA